MITVADLCQHLDNFAPRALAEEWDNVGLLVGRRDNSVRSVMTCLTITPESVAEAIAREANMIVAHHPLPFRPIKQITDDSTTGRMLLDLIRHEISVYSPHTAFDSAAAGINRQLAERIALEEIRPIEPDELDPNSGGGRIGRLPQPSSLGDLAERVREAFELPGLHLTGDKTHRVEKIAVACGAAGTYLSPALRAGADALITGETNFHTCLEAKARGAGLILVGHFPSERFAVEALADRLTAEFDGIHCWASQDEVDPVQWLGP